MDTPTSLLFVSILGIIFVLNIWKDFLIQGGDDPYDSQLESLPLSDGNRKDIPRV